MSTFSWQKLKKRPLYVLAPMADVTDCAFRAIIAKYGKPDITWTEFVSADGLVRATPEGKKKLLKDLEYTESERPIIAQLFGSNVENMEKASMLCKELGFDGIDINMGCPDKSIEKQGAGAGMIKNPKKAQEIIRAAMTAGLPVSVKTRIGYNKNELDTWLPAILETKPALVTIHARTRKEMSLVPADWNQVKKAVEIRNQLSPETLIFGNGDTTSIEDAKMKAEFSGADGVMLGRAIFGAPWLFSEKKFSLHERLDIMVEHTKLFEEKLGGIKNFAIMKKHYKAYVNGFDGAGDLRGHLMTAENAWEVENIVDAWKRANIKA
ncbi:MAG: tRNA-dihydrouridine synthase [bacterium]